MKDVKRVISPLLVIFLLASSLLFLMPAQQVDASMKASMGLIDAFPKQVRTIDAFISDARWKDGASYGNIKPKWSTYDSKGCCAYCADYVRYCYDSNTLGCGTQFKNINDIRVGDVVLVGNANSKENPGHWFVVIGRNGNKLRVAEGNVDPKNNGKRVARVGWNYTINGNKFTGDPKNRPFSYGYHYMSGTPTPTPDPLPNPPTSANIKDGTYMLKNVGSNYAMNWAFGTSAKTVWLAKYGDEDSNEQHFKFTHTGNGKYKIESCHSSGYVVNCECSAPVYAGAKVTVRTYSNNDTQKFYITHISNGNYVIRSASDPSLVIGAPSGSLHAALEIQTYSKSNKNQLWSFSSDPSIKPTYTVSTASVSNGTVKLSKTSAKEGEEITITATPNTGYMLNTIKVNGTAITGKTFKMPGKNTTVEVTFKKAVYKITLASVSNGSASLSKTTGSMGDQITVNTSPAYGYELNWIKYNDNTVSGNKFTMPAADVTVTVNFRRKDAPALGATVTVGNFIYKVTGAASDGTGTVTLTGVATKSESVSIPATIDINGYKYIVNRIGPNAFKNDKTLKTLYISANIRFIDNCAFYGCSSLVKVSGGAKLEIIGQSAFISCTKLKTFVITSTVLKKIGPTAFYGDKALKTLTIKSTVKLTKAGVKKSLKGSKVKTVKVKKSKVKKYKKFFTKKNAGRKVKVKK